MQLMIGIAKRLVVMATSGLSEALQVSLQIMKLSGAFGRLEGGTARSKTLQ